MRFSCESSKLAYAVNKCSYLASANKTNPITRGVLLDVGTDRLTVSASDPLASSTITYNIDDVIVEEAGKECVDAKSLSAFLSVVSGATRCYSKEHKLLFTAGSSKISLNRMSTQNFPRIFNPADVLSPSAVLTGGALKSIFSISFMVDVSDYAFPVLSGVMLSVDDDTIYSMAASTGRLGYAWHKIKSGSTDQFLLPLVSANLLPMITYDDDSLNIYIEGGKIFFVTDRFTLVSAQLAGEYPHDRIREILTKDYPNEFSVGGKDISEKLRASLVLSANESKANLRRITINNDVDYNLVGITTQAESEIGQMDWSIVGKDLRGLGFRINLLAKNTDDIISAIDKASKTSLFAELVGQSTIKVAIDDEGKHVRIASTGLNALFVISPVGKSEIGGKTPVS
jgi:DNA polymerase-3 subunit beta